MFAQAAAPEKKDLKVGFIPITCATPIIMAHPMGFYTKHGLNVEVVKTAGWAVIRDKTLNKEYDAAHMLSPMPLAITHGRRARTRSPTPCRRSRTSTARPSRSPIKHKDKRDPKIWKGFKFAVPVRLFDAQLPAALLRGRARHRSRHRHPDPGRAAARDGGESARRQHRRLPRPDPFNQRAVYDGVGFIHMLSKEMWEGHPCCAFAASKEFVTTMPNTYAALLKVDHRRHRVCRQAREPQADRGGSDRARQLPQPAGDRAGADPDRHLRRRARHREDRRQAHRLRSLPLASRLPCGS